MTPESSSRLPGLRFPVWVVAVLILAPWLVLLVVVRDLRRPLTAGSQVSAVQAKVTTPIESDAFQAKPGPWGDLRYTRVLIEPPDEFIDSIQPVSPLVTWKFRDVTPVQLTALWRAAGVSDEMIRALDDRANRSQAGNVTQILVAADLIFKLTPEARSTIYKVLGALPENSLYAEPFRFRADTVDEWFVDTPLSAETIAMVKHLFYRRGPSFLFSDLPVVLLRLPTLKARVELVKALSRKSTLIVKLRIEADTDIDALVAYWGRGYRAKDIRPLLESLRRRGSVSELDIAHLLPRLGRARLYTYPGKFEDGATTYMDCYWTVLNFFNPEPARRFQDINVVAETISHDYRPVTGSPVFGDLLLLVQADGTTIHACVYIADNIVFTKNGSSPAAPWILTTIPDVLAVYPSSSPLEIQYFRAKNDPGAEL